MTRQPGITANHRQSCTQNRVCAAQRRGAGLTHMLCPRAASLSCLPKGCATMMSPMVIQQHDTHPRGPRER